MRDHRLLASELGDLFDDFGVLSFLGFSLECGVDRNLGESWNLVDVGVAARATKLGNDLLEVNLFKVGLAHGRV
jgi:hypothetical protein